MQSNWEAGFFAGVFKGAKWEIHVSKNGIRLNNVGNNWHDLSDSSVTKGFLWSSLFFKCNGQNTIINGVPHQLAVELNIAITNISKFSEAKKLLDTFKAKESYFRYKYIKEITSKTSHSQHIRSLSNLVLLKPCLTSVLSEINSIDKLVQ